MIGSGALTATVVFFGLALHDDVNVRRVGGLARRLWRRVTHLIHRPVPTGWEERLAHFRHEAVELLRRRWIALTAATLAGHLTVFLVLLVALRAVGVSSAEVNLAEAFAAWALIRIITTIPITPGGLGVVELGLTGALGSFGGRQPEVIAAVLLYRVLTYVSPIAVGGVCPLVWRRLGNAATVRGDPG